MSDHDILREMYGLTPMQCLWWDRLCALIDEALEQFDKGYAVNVEPHCVELVREIAP